MNRTVHFRTGMDWLSDGAWERESQGDNRERLERLRRNLELARREELTRCQRDPPAGQGAAVPVPALQPVGGNSTAASRPRGHASVGGS